MHKFNCTVHGRESKMLNFKTARGYCWYNLTQLDGAVAMTLHVMCYNDKLH